MAFSTTPYTPQICALDFLWEDHLCGSIYDPEECHSPVSDIVKRVCPVMCGLCLEKGHGGCTDAPFCAAFYQPGHNDTQRHAISFHDRELCRQNIWLSERCPLLCGTCPAEEGAVFGPTRGPAVTTTTRCVNSPEARDLWQNHLTPTHRPPVRRHGRHVRAARPQSFDGTTGADERPG